jgi:hypothetical protein
LRFLFGDDFGLLLHSSRPDMPSILNLLIHLLKVGLDMLYRRQTCPASPVSSKAFIQFKRNFALEFIEKCLYRKIETMSTNHTFAEISTITDKLAKSTRTERELGRRP